MSPEILLIAMLAVGGAAVIVWLVGRRTDRQVTAMRAELQALMAAHVQGVGGQLGQLAQSLTQQLGQVRQELQSGVAASGKLAIDAQKEIAERLQFSTEAIRQISQQIGELQQATRELSDASETLHNILGGAKSRGSLGEIALEKLLEDALPRAAYERQYRFANGSMVDAVVRSGNRLLPIDSKFPLDAYRRMIENGEEARREFAQAVRRHAESIAEKYIVPDEHTLEIALMFVPSEGVYYELLMTEDPKYGRLDEYCRGIKVLPVSPNTCYAYLCAISLSLRGLKVEENARHLLAGLAGLQKQMDSFGDGFEKMGTHLRHAQQAFDESSSRLDRVRTALDHMCEGALPEPVQKPFQLTE